MPLIRRIANTQAVAHSPKTANKTLKIGNVSGKIPSLYVFPYGTQISTRSPISYPRLPSLIAPRAVCLDSLVNISKKNGKRSFAQVALKQNRNGKQSGGALVPAENRHIIAACQTLAYAKYL
jgi:hypothetical protein